MHYEDVKTFLQVCRYGGITQAAQAMFLAQSTVSQRIQRLEKDLQCSLMARRSGVRALTLTPQGQRFYPVAEKLASVWNEAAEFVHTGAASVHRLAVGSIASVYETLLPPLFAKLYASRAGMQVSTLISSSPKLCDMVESGTLDFAFTAMEIRSPTLRCTPVFCEHYCLVCSRGLLPKGAAIDIAAMEPYHELFYSWESKFKRWHEQRRSLDHSPYLVCDTPMAWLLIARTMDFWTVCPDSAVLYLSANGLEFDIHELVEKIPDRTVYLVQRTSGSISDESEIFNREFTDFYQTIPQEVRRGGLCYTIIT